MKQKIIFLFLLPIFINCKGTSSQNQVSFFPSIHFLEKNNLYLSTEEKRNWYTKYIFQDSILGISLEKAYKEILGKKKGDTIIVVIIDMPVKIDHTELKGQLWINLLEIPDNNLDDDDNGYIDDIHGWNFLGDKNKGSSEFVNYEYTRIIGKYDTLYKGKELAQILQENQNIFLEYTRAKEAYIEQMKYSDSNYGRTKVDVFAPGLDIYTTDPSSEQYAFVDGTSAAAAIVSVLSALLRSYYPELSAAQIKFILLNSGIDYNVPIKVGDEEILITFNQLSKSGKIVNAYNALLLAEKIAQKKK